MNISKENAERLQEIAEEMNELLNEYKKICKVAMDNREYENFKYTCLGFLEPGLITEHEWFNDTAKSLETFAEIAIEDSTEEEAESEVCEKCGTFEKMDNSTWCNVCEKQFHDMK